MPESFKIIKIQGVKKARARRRKLSVFMLAKYVSKKDSLSPREVRHVESWINNDAITKQQYERLLAASKED